MSAIAARNIAGLKYVKGNPIDIPSIAGKRALVIEFWATWCPPCRAMVGHMTELSHKYSGKVEFVGVTSENDERAVSEFVERMGSKMDYTVALDLDGSVTSDYMQAYNVSGIPHAFLVNKAGKVVFHGHPSSPEFNRMLETVSME